jgi:hypothetical protein
MNGTKDTRRDYLHIAIEVACLVIFVFASMINIDSAPQPWWDEGWTLTAARTWVEQGHYGPLFMGEPAPPGLEAAFPVTASIALGFTMLGIGVWQGRIVMFLFTLGAVLLMYYLAYRLYSRTVATGTLVVLLLLPPEPQITLLLANRQIVAEMPVLCFALAGYACLLRAFRSPLLFVPLTIGLWSIALLTKLTAVPFLLLAFAAPCGIALLRRQKEAAYLWGFVLLGTMVSWQLLNWVRQVLMVHYSLPVVPVERLYGITAFVPILHLRLETLYLTLLFGSPTVLAFIYAVKKGIKNWNPTEEEGSAETVRWSLLILASSWFAWYAFLSAGRPRYFLPPLFLGSMFVAAMLSDLVFKISESPTAQEHLLNLRSRKWKKTAGVVLGVITAIVILNSSLQMLFGLADRSVYQVANFLNTATSPQAVIETYDTELFFLLNRRYHYPPDQVHVELMYRLRLEQAGVDHHIRIDYDPLAADPDYLVVGPFMKVWRLYDAVLKTGVFRHRRSYGGYDIYQRVR